jgi:membrane associated rhomboid family serine protease
MIPISDDNPTRSVPVMTVLLILANVAVYIWELSLGNQLDAALGVYGFTPAELLRHAHAHVADTGVPVIATVFISMFLHGSILHIAGNMLYLWIFGNNIEDATGHIRFVVFYLLSGLAAAFTMAFMDPTSSVPMVGASGAISGVLAAYMVLYPRARVTVIIPLGIIFFPFRINAVWVVGIWFLMQLFFASITAANQPGVAWWAHVGGFAAGIVLTPFFKARGVPYFGPVLSRGPWRR